MSNTNDARATPFGREDLWQLVSELRDCAIFLLDRDGRVASWNSGAQQLNGYAAAEVVGQHVSMFYPPEAVERRWPEQQLRVAGVTGRFENEGWRLRRDGSRFWANVVITALRERGGELRGYATVTRDLTERKRVEALEKAERGTGDLLAALAHELRNSLAPINNSLHLLARKPAADPTEQWVREVLERQTRQMTRQVEKLVDASRNPPAAAAGSEAAEDLPGGPTPPRRVLVVDDNLDAAHALRLLLEEDGHEVRVATDGAAGLAAAREYRPDYLLLDIGLPRLSGYEVVANLRADPALKDTTVIAVTGYGQMHDRARTAAAGFDHHLTKPVEFSALQKLFRR